MKYCCRRRAFGGKKAKCCTIDRKTNLTQLLIFFKVLGGFTSFYILETLKWNLLELSKGWGFHFWFLDKQQDGSTVS